MNFVKPTRAMIAATMKTSSSTTIRYNMGDKKTTIDLSQEGNYLLISHCIRTVYTSMKCSTPSIKLEKRQATRGLSGLACACVITRFLHL
jgi:hypothetical protein